jgi:VIT1/CCC1 family predicted Fe2+/Mn2+ transporter
MPAADLAPETREAILTAQRSEITEYHIYQRLAVRIDDEHNRDVVERIARQEKEHYDFWREHTNRDVQPSRLQIWLYLFLATMFGITFAIKLMERGEEDAQETYEQLAEVIHGAERVVRDEEEHEQQLVEMIDERRLRYIGSIVRGLNDALVELSGAVAGLTIVLNSTSLIGVTGFITGIAASLSMAGSEYLGSKSEKTDKNPVTASFYTGGAYLLVVLFLIFPYFVVGDVILALTIMLFNVLIVVVLFTFYTSVTRDLSFWHEFREMAAISLGIAAVTFVIGFAIRSYFGVEV